MTSEETKLSKQCYSILGWLSDQPAHHEPNSPTGSALLSDRPDLLNNKSMNCFLVLDEQELIQALVPMRGDDWYSPNKELLRREQKMPISLANRFSWESIIQYAIKARKASSEHKGYDEAFSPSIRITFKGRRELALHKESKIVKKERSAIKTKPECSHATDFTSVVWYGTRYTFTLGNQSNTVRVLWEAYESGGHCLAQETIREKIGSAAEGTFELSKVFRSPKKDGKGYEKHPAWNTMIRQVSKGTYKLTPPDEEKTRIR